MHPVTKILVVLAAVLAIALAALSVAVTTNAQRIGEKYLAETMKRETISATLQQAVADSSAELARLQSESEMLRQQTSDALKEKEVLQRENNQLLADAKTARLDADSIQARIDQLAATSQTQAELLDSMYSEVSSLRESELRSSQQEIQLADRISDLSAELEVAIETNRALQERLASLQPGGGGLPQGSRTNAPRGPVYGTITDVREDASGRMLAEVNLGSADRVEEGMKLTIFRGNQYLGNLVVDNVDLNVAIGEVRIPGNQSFDVRRGDRVRTRIR